MDAKEVAKHNTASSCWIIIHKKVYDVTGFLSSHPGGARVILACAGRDATAEFDPVHPPGTLEENLSASQMLGDVDVSTLLPVESVVATASRAGGDQGALPPVDEQLNLDDFENTARAVLSEKAWAYYHSASDDLVTKVANNTAYRSILLRPRVFVDVRTVDTATTVCGEKIAFPVFVAPAAMARLAHETGEAGIATACGEEGVLQCVSNNASMSLEDIMKGRVSADQPAWFQLYVQDDRKKSEAVLEKVGRLGFRAVVLTLDAPTPGKREADERAKNAAGLGAGAAGGGSRGGLGKALSAGTTRSLTWKDLKWLRSHTQLPIILKGVQTHEDARIAASKECLDLGVKGIVLSNHGGRAMDTAPPPIYVLMEIRKYAPEVLHRLEVYVDGGIRRGTDIVKALCLGARAVAIGRPALFGLSGYGPEGVRRVLEILREEVETAMRLLGVHSVGEMGLRHVCYEAPSMLLSDEMREERRTDRFDQVNTRALEGLIYHSPEGPQGAPAKAKL